MSIKLRELIRNVRACKTAAEERAVIAKECALIRTVFKSGESSFRHRNVAKLLYIHMLGFPTHWGQMECLKLIASPHYPEKRIGYLGLMVLLDEKQKVLMLVTNSLKNDLANTQNPYVVGLALCALGNISTADMSRDLANEVEKLLKSQNPYVRKKAALCAIRIIRKVPELVDEFVASATNLLNDANHSVLLTGISLIIEMIRIEPKVTAGFRKTVPTLVRLLKNLLLGGYVNEYDVVGITDPFLQSKIIHLFRLLGHGNAEASELMNDILAQVAINTEPTKNPGNAILYECVQTIMSIEAENGLRVLAINLLGRFLQNRDNNIRYVALNTLCKVVDTDTQAVQRHRQTVVECLKDADISIRRRALDLIYALVTKNNVRALVKELLNYLALTSGDVEFKADLTDKICLVAEKFAPSKRWQIDTVVSVLAIAGNYTRENVPTDLIILIARSKTLHAYAAHKLYSELRKEKGSPLSQLPLVHVGLWCIGEYGDYLISEEGLAKANAAGAGDKDKSAVAFEVASEGKVLDLIGRVIKSPESKLLTKEYALNALIKLAGRFPHEADRLRKLVATYENSMSLELQQRSVEYGSLFAAQLQKIRNGLIARMPIPSKPKKERKDEKSDGGKGKKEAAAEDGEDSGPELDDEKGAVDDDENEEDRRKHTMVPSAKKEAAPADHKPAVAAPPAGGSILDFGVFGGGPAAVGSAPAAGASTGGGAAKPAGGFDILNELFGGGGGGAAPAGGAAPSAGSSGGGGLSFLDGAFGGSAPAPSAGGAGSAAALGALFGAGPVSGGAGAGAGASAGGFPPAVVYSNNGITITFAYDVNQFTPGTVTVTASIQNKNAGAVSGFDFQVAVPKFITLTLDPPSSTSIASGGAVTQKLKLENSQHGKKKIVIRARVVFTKDGQQVVEDIEIKQFP